MTSSWFFLSTLNYDARSATHQIHILCSTALSKRKSVNALHKKHVSSKNMKTITFYSPRNTQLNRVKTIVCTIVDTVKVARIEKGYVCVTMTTLTFGLIGSARLETSHLKTVCTGHVPWCLHGVKLGCGPTFRRL